MQLRLQECIIVVIPCGCPFVCSCRAVPPSCAMVIWGGGARVRPGVMTSRCPGQGKGVTRAQDVREGWWARNASWAHWGGCQSEAEILRSAFREARVVVKAHRGEYTATTT